MSGIAEFLGVRPAETRVAIGTAGLFFVTQAGHGLAVNTADALFFLRFGVEHLPLMILIAGLVVMLASLGHSAGLGRMGAARWLPAVFVAFAALQLALRGGIALDLAGIYPAVWQASQVVVIVTLTMMWNAAGEVCDTRQAKRLFPLFASAGIGGGIVGNIAVGPLAATIGTENILLLHAGLLVVSAALARRLARMAFDQDQGPAGSVLGDLRSGLRIVTRSPLLRLAAAAAMLVSTLFFLVVFPFSEVVSASFDTEADVAGFLGIFSAVATAATFLVSLFLANRVFARLGVIMTMLIVPIVYAAGFSLWIGTFGLVAAAAFRGVQWVAGTALGFTALTSLFNVVPGRRRGQVMTFVSGVASQFGTVLSGLILIVGTSMTIATRSIIGLGLAVVVLFLVLRMRSAYTAALVEAVGSGVTSVFASSTPGLPKPTVDADAARALRVVLADPKPSARAVAITMLGRSGDPETLPLIRESLADDSAVVRAAALQALVDAEDPGLVDVAIDALIDPAPRVRHLAVSTLLASRPRGVAIPDAVRKSTDPRVRTVSVVFGDRAEAAAALDRMVASPDPEEVEAGLTAMAHRSDLAARDLTPFLASRERRVRASAARALAGRGEAAPSLVTLLDDPSLLVRKGAASALAKSEAGRTELREVLKSGSIRATDAALTALVDAGMDVAELDAWAIGESERAAMLQNSALALEAGQDPSPGRGFLAGLLRARHRTLAGWALQAAAVGKDREQVGVVARGVWSTDPETRAQSLEAIETITNRNVARVLIPLIESTTEGKTANPRTVLRDLTTDMDPWIRAGAVHALLEEILDDAAHLRRTAATDPSPLVRQAVPRWTTDMEVVEHMETMDRVLALKQVPMLSELDPEDLALIAGTTVERHYDPHEMVYAEGAEGTEMLIIVEGEVVVRRAAGREVIRTYGPGQHVGELSLLRGGSRAADVLAGDDGLRGLALERDDLHAILEERPEVALAMMATLAERLATM